MKSPLSIILPVISCFLITACSKTETGSEARATTFNGSIGETDLLLHQNNEYIANSLQYAGVVENVSLSSSTTSFGWGRAVQSVPNVSVVTQFTPNEDYTIVLFDSSLRRSVYIAKTILAAPELNDRPAVRFLNCVISTASMALVNDTNRLIVPSSALGGFPALNNTEPFTPSFAHAGKIRLVNASTGTVLDSLTGVSLEPNKYYTFFASGVPGATGVNKPKLHLQVH